MSKIKRRIEITAFRRQQFVTKDAAPEQPAQTSTTDDESIVSEVIGLVKRLTGGSPDGAIKVVREAKARSEGSGKGVSDLDVRRTWILLGDPTMRVK